MNVRAPSAEGGQGKGTHFVAIVNSLIDVCKEVFDSLHKLGRSVHQRAPSEVECAVLHNGNHIGRDDKSVKATHLFLRSFPSAS